MRLYDNAFSPFARKVRLALDHKGFDSGKEGREVDISDGLDGARRQDLAAVNGRLEVPALVDGDVTVINSADIVAYLEHKYPEPPLYPADPAARAQARAWERCADTVVDPILVDISYWGWAERSDSMPAGMLDAARQDMEQVYDALERQLGDGNYLCGELSIAELALFPQLTGTRKLGVPISIERHPSVMAWYKRLRKLPIFAADLERTKTYLADPTAMNVERRRIFWRGDRIEWVLARGYHEWLAGEIEADRVIWPGLGIPQARS